MCLDFVFNDTATTEIYTYCHTLSLHYALPILQRGERERYRQIRQTLTAWYPEVHELTMDVFIGGHFQAHIERTRKGYQRAELYQWAMLAVVAVLAVFLGAERSEEHTSELQSLMRTSYAVFCFHKTINTKSPSCIHLTKNKH